MCANAISDDKGEITRQTMLCVFFMGTSINFGSKKVVSHPEIKYFYNFLKKLITKNITKHNKGPSIKITFSVIEEKGVIHSK